MKQVYLLMVLVLTFNGCTSTNVTRATPNTYSIIQETSPILIITSQQIPPPNSIEIGEFEHKEGTFGSGLWLQIKPKILKIARSSGANVVRIYDYSMTGMIYSSSLSGKLYRYENDVSKFQDDPSNKLADCSCAIIHVLRYEGNLSLRSAFPIKLFVNNTFKCELPSTSERIIEVKQSGPIVLSPYIDGGGITVNVEVGKEYYIYVTQEMSSISNPSMIGVTVGSKIFELIDSEEGRLRSLLINKR